MHRFGVVFARLKLEVTLAAVCYSIGGCQAPGDAVFEEVSAHRYPIAPADLTISVTNRDGSINIYGAGGDVREVRVETVKRAYTPERLKAISIQVSAERNSISIETN